MADFTAADVKALREVTGAGMMDCKKALKETNGNRDEAVDFLRKKGLAAAAKKAGRTASEGLVALKTDGTKGVLVEVNSETDFVARNDKFQSLVQNIAALALQTGSDTEALKGAELPETGKNVVDSIADAVGVIGENMALRRSSYVAVDKGLVAGYMHSAQAPGLGKIGVLVALESEADEAGLQELGKQIAMHVAAASPEALNIETLDPAAVQRERDVLTAQAKDSGKPDAIIAKMVEGRLRKYYEESVLLEQVFVIDTDKKVKQVVAEASKSLGKDVTLKGFVRMALGEGIEKKEDDLAAEVAKLAG